MMSHTDELFGLCEGKKHIYIYGAGKNARKLYYVLQKNKIQVTGFIVSSMSGNPQTLFGNTVTDANSFCDNSEYLIFVPALRTGNAYKDIFETLIRRQIRHVYFMPADMLDFVTKDYNLHKKNRFCTGKYRLIETEHVEIKHEIFAMKNAAGEECHWRFPQKMLYDQSAEYISDYFSDKTALEEFEHQYGTYHVLQTKEPVTADGEDTYAVYMARSHVDRAVLPESLPSFIIPIQVGAALTDADICTVKDNTGENISGRNGNYSECTAIYWMWKNAPKTDYIGLCHYRRHFELNEEEIKKLSDCNVDVLVTTPSFVYQTVGMFFAELIPKADINVMLEVMRKVNPHYVPSAEEFLSSRFYPPCNLFIMKYEHFQEYAAFVFSVTFGMEEYYDKMGYYRKDRYMGFIIECLLGIFLMKQKDRLKIAYTDMRFYRP